jgi:hypothetical protein
MVLCPRCGWTLAAGDDGQVDCDHCGGCWQVDGMVAELWRWYLDAAVIVALRAPGVRL